MGSSKMRGSDNQRFRPGAVGACEATLFRFTSTLAHGAHESKAKDVAAIHLDEAYAYARRRYPEYRISRIETGDLIEMVSGSPLD